MKMKEVAVLALWLALAFQLFKRYTFVHEVGHW